MSHYIQDNQCVITTEDGAVLLLMKGGSNNTFSASTNRRCSSWHYQNVFTDKSSYDNFIEDVLATDINGGMWQFKSLKNKRFEGITGYEAAVVKRFENAFKRSLHLDRKMSEITLDNIGEYERAIEQLMLKSGFSLKDEDGRIEYIELYSHAYCKSDEEKIARVKPVEYPVKHNGFRDFVLKYENTSKEEAFMDIEFCRAISEYKESWGSISMLPRGYFSIPNDNFQILIKSNLSSFLWMWEGEINSLIQNYPEQLKFTLDDGELFKEIDELIVSAGSDEDTSWKQKDMLKTAEMLKKFYAESEKLIQIKKDEIASERKKAPGNFINLWNELERYTFYKNTNTILPEKLRELEKLKNTGSFSLDDVKSECRDSFSAIVSNYRNQYRKNQKAIKELAGVLVEKYSELLSNRTIKELCEHFSISSSATTEKQLQQSSLF